MMAEAKVTFETEDFDRAEPGKEQLFGFNCPKSDQRCEGLTIFAKTDAKHDPMGQNGGVAQWVWNGNRDNPTFTPSINCASCWHGFIRNGRTVDCAGVEEPEIKRVRT